MRWRLSRRTVVTVILAVSLGLNLLVAGVAIGVFQNRQTAQEAAPMLRDRGLIGLIAVLPPEPRAQLRKTLRQGGLDRTALRQSEASARQAFLSELTAPEPSEARLLALLAEQRQVQARAAARLEAALAKQIVAMPAAERQQYAERLQRLRRDHDRGMDPRHVHDERRPPPPHP